jgi:hypothetical protein
VIRHQGLRREKAERPPVIRDEFDTAGAMVHCDTKKLGRIVGGPAIASTATTDNGTGTWAGMCSTWRLMMRAGWSLRSCLAMRKARTAPHFLIRAVRWFRAHGVTVDGLLTDNGSPYSLHGVAQGVPWRRTPSPRHPNASPADQWQGGALDPLCAQRRECYQPRERTPSTALSGFKGILAKGLAPLIVTAPRIHRSGAARGGREGCPAPRENPQ